MKLSVFYGWYACVIFVDETETFKAPCAYSRAMHAVKITCHMSYGMVLCWPFGSHATASIAAWLPHCSSGSSDGKNQAHRKYECSVEQRNSSLGQ